MLNWWKEKRAAKAKAELERIATHAVDLANEAMTEWAATSLEMRRQALVDSFDERLTQLPVDANLSFHEAAEIEVLALLKNWIERKDEIVNEIAHYIDPNAWSCLKSLEIAETFIERLSENFDVAGHALTKDLMLATEEEAKRRGLNN